MSIPFLKSLKGKGRQASLAPGIVADIVTHHQQQFLVPYIKHEQDTARRRRVTPGW